MNVNPAEISPTERVRHRSIEYSWPIGEPVAGDGKTSQQFAVLSVMSFHPDKKVYTATLREETEDRYDHAPNISARSFGLFGGERIIHSLSPRFSQKDLEAFAAQALAEVKVRYEEGDSSITRFFTNEADVPVAA